MRLRLIRVTEGDDFTEGRLYINGRFECYTVEDRDRHLEDGSEDKVYGETAIPRGIYPVNITPSNRFKRDLIAVDGVPGFVGIRIHSGNSSEDTEGCIIVGSSNKSDDDNWVSNSRHAYIQLHEKVQAALSEKEKVTLEVI